MVLPENKKKKKNRIMHQLRESLFNMARGDEDIGWGLQKFLDTRKGGSEKNCWARRGLQKIVYFKTNLRWGAPKKLNR